MGAVGGMPPLPEILAEGGVERHVVGYAVKGSFGRWGSGYEVEGDGQVVGRFGVGIW